MKFLRRQAKKAQRLANSAKKSAGKVVATATVLGGTVANASASYSVPAPDYTDFFAGVGVMLGVAMTIMLARKLKGFIR